MRKSLFLIIALIIFLCSCGKSNNIKPQPTGYLEDPILDNIPSITIDESLFSYIGQTYEQLCTEFKEEGVLYEYEDYYEYLFNNKYFKFRYPIEDENGETPAEEPTVFEFTAKVSDFIRMDYDVMTKYDVDLILGEGEFSPDNTYIQYLYNIYIIDISCDGENIYLNSPIVIKRVSADN